MSDAVDAHPEAGAIQGGEAASDASGMSVEDAATSAFDDWDRGQNGIAEGERENVGQFLKFHADSAGTAVIGGLNSLIEPAVALRHGSMEEKRGVINGILDDYGITPLPMAEPEPVAVPYGQPAHDGEGQPIATDQEALDAVNQFASDHPGAQDERVVDYMTHIAHDMRRQGLQPTLEAVYHHATVNDPRFSASAREAQATQRREAAARQQAADPERVAKAKQGSVQVSGSGSSGPSNPDASDDLDDIIREQFGR